MSQQPKRTRSVSIPSVTKNLLTRFVLLPTATTVASVMSLNWCSVGASTPTNRRMVSSLLNKRNRWKNCSKGIPCNHAPLLHLYHITQWSNGVSMPKGGLLLIYLIPHGHVIVSFLNRIIIVSRGGCPTATLFKYREAHYPIPFFLGGSGENDQIR